MALMCCFATTQQSAAQSSTDLKWVWSSEGLESLTYKGHEFVKSPRIYKLRAEYVFLKSPQGEIRADSENIASVKAKYHIITQVYKWSKISYRYSIDKNQLNISARVDNTGSLPIEKFTLTPIFLNLGNTATFPSGNNSNVDDLAFSTAKSQYAHLSLYTASTSPTFSTNFGIAVGREKNEDFGVAIKSVQRDIVDYIDLKSAILPGGSKTYKVSLVFSPPNVAVDQLKRPLYEQRAPSVVPTLQWRDRRPMGSLFLSSSAKFPANPRGWFNDGSLNISTQAGLRAFRARLLYYADNSIRNLQKVNAQGVIVWDVEGQEMPHPISYLGSPAQLSVFAPEMHAIADEFFARFRKAGLQVGLCLRPSQLRRGKIGEPKWVHTHMGFDPVAQLSEKIKYAQQRWGCRLFYIDSNATFAFTSAHVVTSWKMRAKMMRNLQKLHPDVLLIPEHESYDYWGATAPYQELDRGDIGTPASVRWSFPQAFSVINIADGAINNRRPQLVQAVKNGDVLLFRCWFDDGTHSAVQSIYQEAAGSTQQSALQSSLMAPQSTSSLSSPYDLNGMELETPSDHSITRPVSPSNNPM